jgi:hypothetical protein|tara:strand:- start:2149 stop:2763 length:615 start_codon:yes stop_codon:yes gene_type:complete
MKTLNENSSVKVEGHVVIKDFDSGEVLLDKYNAINFQNFAMAVAKAMSNQAIAGSTEKYFISKLAFGYGGTTIGANGNITYKDARVSGEAVSGLYSPSPATIGANAVTHPLQVAVTTFTVNNAQNQPYSDLECKTILDYNQPDATGPAIDNSANFDTADDFVFDEIALMTEAGTYLTHLIFHPIQKSNNRKLEILYTLRIRAGV